ncbi:MAG: hypothetical protein MK102_18820, partial [Fuerstiella sp.]|nr:hypothetical protein [Fuerstiella sp.]
MLSEFHKRVRLSGTAEFSKAIQMHHGYRPRVRLGTILPFTAIEQLETRVLLSGSSLHDDHAGVDVPFDVFTQQEIAAFENVDADSNLSSKTPSAGAADSSHGTDVLTFVLDFKESTQPTTTDIFGNEVSTFDVTGYGFSAVDFDTVANAVLAEVDDDYFTELIGTVANPANQHLDIDFIIGDIGTAPSGITEYYFVQIGEGIAGPHSNGILGVAGGSVVRNSSGTGPNSGIANGDVVASVFTDAIGTLSNLTPSNALTSGNLGFTTNAIAGTTSHEIAHTLSLSHISKSGSVQPTTGASPIMGTGAIDLPNNDRISDREFSLSGVDGQNNNAPQQHIQQLVDAVGLHSTEVVNTAAIRGQKWNDLDGDGLRDANEPPLNGWTIQLFNSGGTLVGTQLTADVDLDSSGSIDPQTESGVYVFTELAADSYTISEVQQNGWIQTAPVTSDVFIQDFETALGANETASGNFSINATNATLNNGTQMMGHTTSYGNNEYSFYEVALDLTGRNDVRLQFDYAAHIENTFDGFNVQASGAAINPPGDLITP